MVVVDVYVSPNSGWAAFVEFLDGIDPLLPRQQVGMLRQQGVRGKAARRARHSAGLGVGTDPVGHRVRRGTALPAASGPGHGVLRALVLGATPVDDTLVLVAGGTRHCASAKSQRPPRFMLCADWAWDSSLRNRRPSGSTTRTGEGLLHLV